MDPCRGAPGRVPPGPWHGAAGGDRRVWWLAVTSPQPVWLGIPSSVEWGCRFIHADWHQWECAVGNVTDSSWGHGDRGERGARQLVADTRREIANRGKRSPWTAAHLIRREAGGDWVVTS